MRNSLRRSLRGPALTALALAVIGLGTPPAPAGGADEPPVVIKMATIAPDGTSWHQILKAMGEKWRQATGGQVTLRIYPGGVQGDEPAIVRKMRVGQLQAGALTAVGLSDIDDAVAALQIPMMFRSYEELDFVRERLRPTLEKRLSHKGFVVLNWGDAGWVMFYAKEPFSRPDDLKKMKLFVWEGDSHAVDIWRSGGFHPVPLASTDILPGLQTGLINAFDTTPLAALSSQTFALAPHLLDLKWAPLVGGTVITKKAWESTPSSARPRLLEAAAEAGERLKGEIRAANEKALEEMKKRGLKVQPAPPALEAEWQRAAEGVYPKIRGTIIPADMFDEVRRLRDEFRASVRSPTR